MKFNIPLFKIATNSKDIEYVKRILVSGKSWAVGPSIIEFEEELKKLNKSKYAVTFNSGTSALIAMYKACNLNNDEIIVPSFSFIATASSVLLSGNKLKFCDIEKETYGISFSHLKKIVNKRTKAVVIVHYSGSPARDTIKIKNFCKKNKIMLLEDNAHSYGAKLNDKLTGTFGKASIMSFCQNKLISTGEGGAVVTNDTKVYEKLKLIRSHGRLENSKDDYFYSINEFDYIDIGFNFRMPSMNASLGISQIRHSFIKNIKRRQEIAIKISEILSRCKYIILPKKLKNADHLYQQYTIRLKNTAIKERDNLKNYLLENGIISRVFYEPIHLKTFYKKICKTKKLVNTEYVSKSILTLPIFPTMKKNEIVYMTSKILSFFEN